MEQMTTLSEVLNNLKAEGYTQDFNLNPEAVRQHPENFIVDQHYRFEGESNPDDEAVVYAISSLSGDVKGVLVDGYGTSSNEATEDLVKPLKERNSL